MLPKKDGWTVVTELRAQGISTRVLFLTARDSVEDRVKGLELGADDYLVKPFAFSELLARIRTLMRRIRAHDERAFHVADLEIDTQRNRVKRRGVPLDLTGREFLLLVLLARSVGEIVSRSQITTHLWGVNFKTETNVVEAVVCRLRAKVDDPFETKLIRTIRGVGYFLKDNAI